MIHIFNDTTYGSYQHVNQMLFRHLNGAGYPAFYLQRFKLNFPSICRLRGLIKGNKRAVAQSDVPRVIEVRNSPSICDWFDRLNSNWVASQIEKSRDIAITFVPSLALAPLFDQYHRLVYYCVHDSDNQTYPVRNKRYEKRLVQKSALIFCDNLLVLKRLCAKEPYINLADISHSDTQTAVALLSKARFFLVPPPTPDPFFEVKAPLNSDFDLMYFGSVHKDLDETEFLRLANLGLRIALVTADRLALSHRNIKYLPLEVDSSKLAQQLSRSAAIFMPYRDNNFNASISPGKLNQVIASGKPVICSNRLFCQRSGFVNSRVIDSREKFQEAIASAVMQPERALPSRASHLLQLISNLIVNSAAISEGKHASKHR
ncbi:hypothetical protein [Amantichitinum ursilacus]|uniref:Glycosyl transferases group 1 n=1 Tax=Amantichitinum ursilacus TaxID=857265 RepID=A0A0N0XHV4_9NEIS|nr:hypothetical protein [Amantichitinum ursilacus]KPC52206.1 hypothetical protein WG78_14140 [Amantichitinum ursilacus]